MISLVNFVIPWSLLSQLKQDKDVDSWKLKQLKQDVNLSQEKNVTVCKQVNKIFENQCFQKCLLRVIFLYHYYSETCTKQTIIIPELRVKVVFLFLAKTFYSRTVKPNSSYASIFYPFCLHVVYSKQKKDLQYPKAMKQK